MPILCRLTKRFECGLWLHCSKSVYTASLVFLNPKYKKEPTWGDGQSPNLINFSSLKDALSHLDKLPREEKYQTAPM